MQVRCVHCINVVIMNGLLEYALLLAESEASQRSQIHWLVREACSGISRATGSKEPTIT
jgi:hypothetical protein